MRQLLGSLCIFSFLLAAQEAKPKSALDKLAFEAYVRHLLLLTPEVKVTISEPKPSEVPGFKEVMVRGEVGPAREEWLFYVSADGQKIVQGTVYDIAKNPFQKDLERLKTTGSPSIGTPGAPVVMVIFSDFQCGYCKQEAQSIRGELLKTFPTQVRAYFKDMPLDQIHPWARPAAVAGRCVFRQKPALFWDYHDYVFEKQGEITEQNLASKLAEFIQSKGLDAVQFEACQKSPAAGGEIERSIQEARELGVKSTPTVFLNGRKIPGYVPWENLKQIIQFELNYQATAKNAGEKCCVAPSPSLLSPQPNPVLPK